MIQILAEFAPRLLSGFAVNLELAALSLLLGAALGAALVLMMMGPLAAAAPARGLVAVMRAAPTFVVMFFLLNVAPRHFAIAGVTIQLDGLVFVIVALALYAAAYTADNGLVAARAYRSGDVAGALLLVPNMVRAFVVLVMSSAMASAVGTPEAISATLHEAERLPSLGAKVALFVSVMLLFTAVMQVASLLTHQLRRKLEAVLNAGEGPQSHRAGSDEPSAALPSTRFEMMQEGSESLSAEPG